MSNEIQLEIANLVIAQPDVANELKKLANMSEQESAKMVEDFFRRCAAFMPLASAMKVNVLLTFISMFAEHAKHPVLLKVIEDHNQNAFTDS